ncbi:MAG: AzlC family ABC transporter permease [Solobacterium sp.]|nr:AzlC family ABC transporter permease [Solobacterium sp.]
MNRQSLDTLKAALPHTIPVMTGYIPLGIAYGVFMTSASNPFWYPTLTSIVIYGGSLEFLVVSMLAGPFNLLQTFLVAVMVQARHLFYGLAMLEKYKGTGYRKWYLIYTLTDETFSINCSANIPEGINRYSFWECVSRLDHIYWMTGCTIGGLLGQIIHFNTEGLDFVMTSMFTVILLNQLLKEKSHFSAWIGAAASLICLLLFGRDSFLIPAMAVIILMLTVFRKPIERSGDLS